MEGVEAIRRKCLFIDDEKKIIYGIQRLFRGYTNFTAVECHSVDEALNAIKANSPEVLFLDHSLTRGGNEGLQIAIEVQKDNSDIEIVSVTMNDAVGALYKLKGIKHISKNNIDDLERIVSGA